MIKVCVSLGKFINNAKNSVNSEQRISVHTYTRKTFLFIVRDAICDIISYTVTEYILD